MDEPDAKASSRILVFIGLTFVFNQVYETQESMTYIHLWFS